MSRTSGWPPAPGARRSAYGNTISIGVDEARARLDACAEQGLCAQCGSPRSSLRHEFTDGHEFAPWPAPSWNSRTPQV